MTEFVHAISIKTKESSQEAGSRKQEAGGRRQGRTRKFSIFLHFPFVFFHCFHSLFCVFIEKERAFKLNFGEPQMSIWKMTVMKLENQWEIKK